MKLTFKTQTSNHEEKFTFSRHPYAFFNAFLFAQSEDTDTLDIRLNRKGKPEFITFKSNVNKIRSMSSEKDIVSKILGANKTNDNFQLISSKTDDKGKKANKYQYYFKNVKVEYAQFIMAGEESIESISSAPELIEDFNVTPSFDGQEAIKKAIASVNAKAYAWQDSITVQ